MQPPVVDLPPLGQLRGRWAAASAVVTALGFPAAAHAGADRWRWDDGGGNWAELLVADPDRALLVGWDRALPGRAPRQDDVPGWWAHALSSVSNEVAFVLGWDGGAWSGTSPTSVAGLPVDAEALYAVVDSYVEGVADDQGLGDWRTPWPAVAALGAAGPELTVTQLADVLGPLRADLPAGVVAARAFRGPAAG